MDCATVCLLTAAIGFSRGPDTVNCSYCVDTRSTYADCFANVMECAYRDPSSLIICMNIYENTNSFVHHSVRCLSYEQFYVPDQDIKYLGESGMCQYSHVQSCDCKECRSPTTTSAPTTTSNPKHIKMLTSKSKHEERQIRLQNRQLENNRNRTLFQSSAYKEEGIYLAASATTKKLLILFVSCLIYELI